MPSHRLLVASMMLAPKSKCSRPGSFEDETLLICIIYIQEKVHQSIPKADTGLPWMYVVLKFLSCLQFQYQTARCGNIYYQERAFGIFKLCTTIQYKSRPPLHLMPSNSGRRKSASWHRVEIKLQVSGSSWWGGVECINLSLMAFCLRLYASKVLISKSFGRESKQNIFSDNISSWLHLCIILSPQNESEIK